MKDLKKLNSYRNKEWQKVVIPDGVMRSRAGCFQIKLKTGIEANVIADNGIGNPEWEHVSVSTEIRCLTWEEMCEIKELFFEDDEAVIQIHPAKENYVNIHNFCLHLWKPITKKLPLPPMESVL